MGGGEVWVLVMAGEQVIGVGAVIGNWNRTLYYIYLN